MRQNQVTAMAFGIRFGSTVMLVGIVLTGAHAQEEALDRAINQMGLYLLEYEPLLSVVVAEERYEQSETTVLRGGRAPLERVRSRKLESDVAFMRLPGGLIWYGVRDVRKVDGKPVAAVAPRLLEMMQSGGEAALAQASRIVEEGMRHNLGAPRSTNMPTIPLDLLHPDNHVRFVFRDRGKARVDGFSVLKIGFEEFAEPTLVTNSDGLPLFVSGLVWVEATNGRVWRVELTIQDGQSTRNARNYIGTLRVDFAAEATLGLLVPREMREVFFLPRGRGNGRAVYSNYRRFSTAARVVP